MKRRKLIFQNPVFHDGLNVTIRKGDAWANSLDTEPFVYESGTKDERDYIGEARIVGVLKCPLFQVPAQVLKLEHDPACRTKKGILAELQRIYGKISETSEVTVLFFYYREEY